MEIVIRNSQRLIKIKHTKVKRILREALRYLKEKNRLDPLLVACYSSMELSVLFINDRKMRELNLLYRGKDKTTDVLSFPQQNRDALSVMRNELKENIFDTSPITHHGLLPLGDIVINLHQTERQAKEYGITFYQEVERLLIHGLLHLLGFDHETTEEDEKEMFDMQEEILRKLIGDGLVP